MPVLLVTGLRTVACRSLAETVNSKRSLTLPAIMATSSSDRVENPIPVIGGMCSE